MVPDKDKKKTKLQTRRIFNFIGGNAYRDILRRFVRLRAQLQTCSPKTCMNTKISKN